MATRESTVGRVRIDPYDPLNSGCSPRLHYSTTNVGEAMPGVCTPLTWTLWGPIGDAQSRRVGFDMGVLTRAELRPATTEDAILQIVHGRIAMQMEYLMVMCDRIPGADGTEAVRTFFGRAPDTLVSNPTWRRYPAVAAKLPYVFATAPGRMKKLAAGTDAWWRTQTRLVPSMSRAEAARGFTQAANSFHDTLCLHSLVLCAVVQPLYDALAKLIDKAGTGDIGVLSGSGGAEMAIVGDMWRASRDEIPLSQVIESHGFHGPFEGELSSHVWRENPAPLKRMIDGYRRKSDHQNPMLLEAAAAERRPDETRMVLAALPASRRPGAKALLALAASRIPYRGVGKRSYVQSIDVARQTARRFADCLVTERLLDDPDDVFYLTMDEVTGELPRGYRELIEVRKRRRMEYQQLELPNTWRGVVTPTSISTAERDAKRPARVEGIGVSDGVVVGVVRVVTDPSFDEVEDDEILVAPTTDPSWASIMFISAGLVVDIGGAFSHAAVVARELEIPCVVNTGNGTSVLRTGDRVRLNGKTGTIDILERQSVEV
jgi:phosphohistidine swiveling domain-containing protein